jgi:hypothetical protein
MVKQLKTPSLKPGSKVEEYVIDLHGKIWELIAIIEPGLTGDCMEVATRVIKKHAKKR